MTNKEFCKLYVGCNASDRIVKGIVCGYESTGIIMKSAQGWGEALLPNNAYIYNKQSGDRYWKIERSMVDINSVPASIPSDLAEKYIKKHFPNALEEDIDIYINIFMAGANSIKL